MCDGSIQTDEELKTINEFEHNLQKAINELIDESDLEPDQFSQHVSMIITHLAMAAASLRIKKQQYLVKNL
ncbi:MAG: hypothetical protein FK734_10860 [Asgard group archaeon]|nr:hypothetical protein [Asgard group archaeon]